MPIELRIIAENEVEYLKFLGMASRGLSVESSAIDVKVDAEKVIAKQTKSKNEKMVEPVVDAEEIISGKLEETEKPENAEKTEKSEVPTKEETQSVTKKVIEAGKRSEVKEILADMGYKNVSGVPEAERADFLAKINELIGG